MLILFIKHRTFYYIGPWNMKSPNTFCDTGPQPVNIARTNHTFVNFNLLYLGNESQPITTSDSKNCCIFLTVGMFSALKAYLILNNAGSKKYSKSYIGGIAAFKIASIPV